MRHFLLLLTFLAAAAPSLRADVVFSPPSAWVEDLPARTLPATPTASVVAGTEWILFDDQIRATAPVERYNRRIVRITSPAGLQNWQEIEIDFDPSYETLILHHVRIQRGNSSIDALPPQDVRVIQREPDLTQRIYDGRLTALLFLRDLRPGDTIDFAWTTRGSNPILDGKFVDTTYLALTEPAREIRWRLVHEKSRDITTRIEKSGAAVVSRPLPGGMVEKRVSVESSPAFLPSVEAPSWVNPWPRVEASEFHGWSDVAVWAARLTSSVLEQSDDASVRATASLFSGPGIDPRESAIRAIRFVQDEIRYLGIEAGPHSHRPHAPSLVLERRFGDCKDKSLLLVQLLRRLGFTAHLALVDSSGGRDLPNSLPSPFAFDHAIVVLKNPSGDIWIDPTITETGGTLETLAPPKLDMALVVAEGSRQLVPIPQKKELDGTRVTERWTLHEDDSASFEVVSVYSGRDADEIRSLVSTTSIEDLGRQYRDYYASSDPSIEPLALPLIDDKRDQNELVVRETYRLRDFWNGASERNLWAHAIAGRILEPAAGAREHPLELPRSGKISHVIEVIADKSIVVGKLGETSVEDAAFRLRARSSRDERLLRFSWEWESLADAVPPSAIETYGAAVAKAEEALSGRVTRRGVLAAQLASFVTPTTATAIVGAGAAATFGALGVTSFFASRRRRRHGAVRPKNYPVVFSTSEISALPEAIHCGRNGVPVGSAARTAGADPASGAPVVRIAVVCPECLTSRTLEVVLELRRQPGTSAALARKQ